MSLNKEYTFVFADIQGSTHLARKYEDKYSIILQKYRASIRNAILLHRGKEVDCAGDGFFIVFDNPINAIKAAISIQNNISQLRKAEKVKVLVRIGIHTGKSIATDSGYTGLAVHKTSRICDAAHGGQIILSSTTASQCLEFNAEPDIMVNTLGKFYLKGFDEPEELYQLSKKALPSEFPAPRVLPALPIVAILPFQDEDDNPDNTYFFQGLSTDIIQSIARIPGLRVIGRSSSYAFTNSKEKLSVIGRKLGANGLLRGSMRKEGDCYYLKVDFFDIDNQKLYWSERYTSEVSDLYGMEDKVIEKIAHTYGIKTKMISTSKFAIQTRTQYIEAYDYYLKGRRFYYQFSNQSVHFALQMFQQAIQVDPDYALPYTGAADCYSYMYMYVEPSEFHLSSADQMSKKAIALSPGLAEAHASRGVVLSLFKEYTEAKACFELAISLDPLLFEAYYLYARVCFAKGDLTKSAGLFRDANRVRPDDFQSLLLAAQCFDKKGFSARAKEVREDGVTIVTQHLKLYPGDVRALCMGANGQAGLGNKIQAIKWLQRALTLEPDDPMLLYNAGCIYALMDMEEEALEALSRAIDAGISQKGWFENDPDLDDLRTSPKFSVIRKKLDDFVFEVV
jgi:class 3 adenylate cyclase/tetratricopeptide (TPR) repeat protein